MSNILVDRLKCFRKASNIETITSSTKARAVRDT